MPAMSLVFSCGVFGMRAAGAGNKRAPVLSPTRVRYMDMYRRLEHELTNERGY